MPYRSAKIYGDCTALVFGIVRFSLKPFGKSWKQSVKILVPPEASRAVEAVVALEVEVEVDRLQERGGWVEQGSYFEN